MSLKLKFFIILTLAFVLLSQSYSFADPNPTPTKWPTKAGEITPTIYIDPSLDKKIKCDNSNGLKPSELANLAAQEWITGLNDDPKDDWPPAGTSYNDKKGKPLKNPKNDATKNGELMEEGNAENQDKIKAGKTKRSYTQEELDALKNKYKGDGKFKPTITTNPKGANISINGVTTLTDPFGTGQTLPFTENNQKKSAIIAIKEIPTLPKDQNDLFAGYENLKWFCTKDGNGDGFITNSDPKPSSGSVDLYSTLKHELGHALSLDHSVTSSKTSTEYKKSSNTTDEKKTGKTSTPNNEKSPTEKDCNYRYNEECVFYFASDRPDGLGGWDIWASHWDLNGWGEPTNLGSEINSEFDEIDPTLFNDNLLFSSNRDGSIGGYDILLSINNSTEWLEPEFLTIINTKGDEKTPSIFSLDKSLYYSSNGLTESQDYDIIKANWNGDEFVWESPETLPLNSEYNEISPNVASNNILYFASDRPDGLGGYDIWYGELNDEEFTNHKLNSEFDEIDPTTSFDLQTLYFVKQIDDQFDILTASNIIPQLHVY